MQQYQNEWFEMKERHMGRLTTHILDTASGRPASGITIEVFQVDGETRQHLASAVTNADGRCDGPILEGAQWQRGQYQLVFHAGPYLRATHSNLPDILFLDEITIGFGIDAADQHYHVPLLLSPYGYSTYRGS